MFNLTEDENINTALIMAFRGSAKSTIFTLSYPIWSILGKQQKKFVIILGQTQRQARQHLINIRKELENNELLRSDLGPFKEIEDEWGSMSLVIPKYNARITAASMEQTIRGMKHMQYRPDLIVCDDIEDLQSVKTKEGRDKIHQWISGEVIPAGDKTTKTIFVGNLLHEDSLLMRIKEKVDEGKMNGKLLMVPLLDEQGEITWKGKFKNMEEIEIERKKIANDSSWAREYLLKILSDQERVIHPEWIQFYDELPEPTEKNGFRFCGTGVDLAISKEESADYTAMVSALVFGYEGKLKIYITPDIINQRLTFPETALQIKTMIASKACYERYRLFIEDVGYQKSIIQHINDQEESTEFKIEEFKPKGDKRSRLSLVSHALQNGTILFPRDISPLLISQLVNFGKEKHDDLADAFSTLCIKILDRDHKEHCIGFFVISDDNIKDSTISICKD
jgi:predicted phage terminase large subunit-like protein